MSSRPAVTTTQTSAPTIRTTRPPVSPPYFLARPAAAWRNAFDRSPSPGAVREESPYPGLAEVSPRALEQFCDGYLPGWLGLKVLSLSTDRVVVRAPVRKQMMAPHGYLHGGTLVSVADSACGFGTIANLPDGARGFTTIELKSNFLGTVSHGHLICEASPWHLGSNTQVWDAVVSDERTERKLAVFRCTQMVLWERRRSEGAD
jgi:1,4-dihydroxy-2-naphthoyl-CoA hydrolase